MVMPGLQDGHIHGITVVRRRLLAQLRPADSRRSSSARIKAAACATRHRGARRLARQVSSWYQQFVIPSGTVLTKDVLDALSTSAADRGRSSSDGHTTLVNSRALALAEITAATPDPADGRIEHGAVRRSPTACCRTARRISSTGAAPGARRRPGRRGASRPRALRRRRGSRASSSPASSARTGSRRSSRCRRRGALTARAHFAAGPVEAGESPASMLRAARKLRARFERASRLPRSVRAWRPARQRGPRLVARPGISIDAVKLFLDGVLQAPAQTAARARALRRNDEPRRALHGQPGPRADAPRPGARRFPAAHPRDRRPCRAHRARRRGGDAPRRRADAARGPRSRTPSSSPSPTCRASPGSASPP